MILSLRYHPNAAPALDHASFSVENSEKIGIVGRTGSGMETHKINMKNDIIFRQNLALQCPFPFVPVGGRKDCN